VKNFRGQRKRGLEGEIEKNSMIWPKNGPIWTRFSLCSSRLVGIGSWQRRMVKNGQVEGVILVWIIVRVEEKKGAERKYSEVLIMLLICLEYQKSEIQPVVVFSPSS
jgi:hypothetical protein